MRRPHSHPSSYPIAWIDTETGGLDPATAALLEVAVIVTDSSGQYVRTRWTCRVHPEEGDVMDPAALAINGYTPETWAATAVRPLAAFQGLQNLVRGAIFAGHNVDYDFPIIMRLMGRYGLHDWPGSHYRVDTLRLAWPLLAERLVPDLKLGTLTRFFGIQHHSAHSAMGDISATVELYRRLMDRWAQREPLPPTRGELIDPVTGIPLEQSRAR